MELKFEKKPLQYLRPFFNQLHTQEQTQEIRLPDSYPDIGKVLRCWGQVLMRGKEWRSTSMGANGGVMVWVLYAPEDGTQPRVVEAWLPTQCRWDFPENADDGIMLISPIISSLDCRGISARKLMIRVGLDTFGQAMRKETAELAQPADVPEDVQLLSHSYPIELPVEAGEKQVQQEEYLDFDDKLPPISKIVSYQMMPMIQEQKVLGDRLVFRGQNQLHMVYMTEEGEIHSWEAEVPFSQYTELDGDYGPSVTAWILPILTAAELEMTEDKQLRMRAGIAAQYAVFDQTMLAVVEDAYSPYREVVPTVVEVPLPVLLDSSIKQLQMSATIKNRAEKIFDTSVFSEYPKQFTTDDGMAIQTNGQFQLLYQDAEEQMTTDSARLDGKVQIESAPDNLICLWPGCSGKTDVIQNGESVNIAADVPITVQIYSGHVIPMITELELGQQRPADDTRPSIILRRAGENTLWEIAKSYGSTVAAIQEANHLEGEPDSVQMLLIPIS